MLPVPCAESQAVPGLVPIGRMESTVMVTDAGTSYCRRAILPRASVIVMKYLPEESPEIEVPLAPWSQTAVIGAVKVASPPSTILPFGAESVH